VTSPYFSLAFGSPFSSFASDGAKLLAGAVRARLAKPKITAERSARVVTPNRAAAASVGWVERAKPIILRP